MPALQRFPVVRCVLLLVTTVIIGGSSIGHLRTGSADEPVGRIRPIRAEQPAAQPTGHLSSAQLQDPIEPAETQPDDLPPELMADAAAAPLGEARRLRRSADRAGSRPSGDRGQAARAANSTTIWVSVFVLAGLLGAAGLGARWLTRHGPQALRPLPTDVLEILGRRSLEPRTSIQLVRVAGRILILGLGPDGARTLAEVTDPVEIDLIAGACRRTGETTSFSDSFQRLFRATSSSAAPAASSAFPATGSNPGPDTGRTRQSSRGGIIPPRESSMVAPIEPQSTTPATYDSYGLPNDPAQLPRRRDHLYPPQTDEEDRG